MNNLDTLKKFFPTGTTEGDLPILERVFITPDQLPEVLACPSGSPRILVGNKGVGKTAILEWICASSRRKQIPSLLIRPDDLDTSSLKGISDIATIKRSMYECFLAAVGDSIGDSLSGYLIGSAAELYTNAVVRGKRDSDWMGS